MVNPKRILVMQKKSTIGALELHKACVRGLGLRRVRQIVDVEDTPSIRGMIGAASHLVCVMREFWNFDLLTAEEKLSLRRTGEALSRVPLEFAIPIYIADMSRPANQLGNANNGTGTLIEIEERKFCVTAAHVIAKYRERADNNANVKLMIGKLEVDLSESLVDEDEDIDLAVIDLNEHSAADITISGEITTGFLPLKSWPPLVPGTQSAIMFGGFPGSRRRESGRSVEWETISSGAATVYDVSTQGDIVCQIETDRVAAEEAGFPMDEVGPLGGLSGGPAIQERKTPGGIVFLDLVGFIYEYSPLYDSLRIRPATHLNKDGTIKRT